MTVLYLDSLFFLNFIINYLLLLATARLVGEPLKRWRLALGGGIGGVYAVCVFIPSLGFLTHGLCKIGVALLMLLVGLGYARRLLRVTLVFFGLACGLGGCILALGLFGGQGLAMNHGVVYSPLDIKVFLLSASLCYGVVTLIFQRSALQHKSELIPCVLWLEERRVALTVLSDSGNTLIDPVNGGGVLVVEGCKLQGLIPQLAQIDLQNPVEAMEVLLAAYPSLGRRLRLLPYQAVGVSCGMLLALRLDKAQVGTHLRKKILVALAPNALSDGGGYCGLIGVERGS